MKIVTSIFLLLCLFFTLKVSAIHPQVCTFGTNSPLLGGSDTNRVGYYYHEDNLNSSSALSSSSGSQQEVNIFYPFGRTQTASPQASFQVSRRFTGQVFDAESGLYYYNARYYDPELGRFIQADTTISDLPNPQSYNRYSYCLNDPLRYNDPSGHVSTLAAFFGFGETEAASEADTWARSLTYKNGSSRGFTSFANAQNQLAEQKDPMGVNADVRLAKEQATALRSSEPAVEGMVKVEINAESSIVAPEATALEGTVVRKLPDEALVVRGGQNLPANFTKGSGVTTDASGLLNGVSVQSAPGVDLKTLSQNIPHNQVGVTTVGDVRAAGGDVIHSPTPSNPHHSTLSGVDANTASDLLRPTIPNPAKQ
jgi:RHS repeat-associated protein